LSKTNDDIFQKLVTLEEMLELYRCPSHNGLCERISITEEKTKWLKYYLFALSSILFTSLGYIVRRFFDKI
jgi:hypothetical protein